MNFRLSYFFLYEYPTRSLTLPFPYSLTHSLTRYIAHSFTLRLKYYLFPYLHPYLSHGLHVTLSRSFSHSYTPSLTRYSTHTLCLHRACIDLVTRYLMNILILGVSHSLTHSLATLCLPSPSNRWKVSHDAYLSFVWVSCSLCRQVLSLYYPHVLPVLPA